MRNVVEVYLSLLKTISLALSSKIRLLSQILTFSVICSFLDDGSFNYRNELGGCLLQSARFLVVEMPVLNDTLSGEMMDGQLRQVVSLLLLLPSQRGMLGLILPKHNVGRW